MNKKLSFLQIATIGILFFSPYVLYAAEFQLKTEAIAPRAGDIFIVDLFLDTQSDVVNALEGSLVFSSNLHLRDIRLSGSLVPLWVTPPQEKETGFVEFAGVLPGGYQGTPKRENQRGPRGNVFTLMFQAQAPGVATIALNPQTAVYLNDGEGTRAKLTLAPLSLSVGPSSGRPQEEVLENDTTPPEPFTPLVTPGEPFGYTASVLVFSTQDKNSGILRFDVARSYNRYAIKKNLSWQEAESPYVLREEDADRYVFVRAVDRAENMRVEVVPPQRMSIRTLLSTWWFIAAGLLLGAILYRYIRPRP